MNILIFAPNHIGDAVMSTPLILTLKKNYQNINIYVFARKNVMDIYRPFPEINFLFEYKKSISDTLSKIREIEFDYSFCLASSFLVAFISKLKGIPYIIGYGRNWRSPLLTYKLPYYRSQPSYIVDFYLNLLKFLEIKEWVTKPFLYVDEATEKFIKERIEGYGVRIGNDKIACLLPGYSGYPTSNTKKWKEENFALVGDYLVKNGFSTFILVGPKEESLARKINSLNSALIPLVNPVLSIQEAKAFLKHINVFVSVDSGLRFIARAYNKRGITIYGPISPYWSLPADLDGEVPVFMNLTCSPCYLTNCPIPTHPCTTLITPEIVIDRLKLII